MLLLEEFEDVIGFQEVKTSKVIEIEKDESDDKEEIPIHEKVEVKKESSTIKCPVGGTLGKDLGKLDECDECELYGDCYETYKQHKLANKK